MLDASRCAPWIVVTVPWLATLAWAAPAAPVEGAAMVASDHETASRCGAEILEMGGNAADAAVATALCAGVVQPAGSGLGGGGFAVVHRPGDDGAGRVIDFREVAPAAAHADLFRLPDGGVDRRASVRGGRAVAVPAESRGLARLHADLGRLPLRRVAAPAVRLARRGFVVGHHLAESLEKELTADVARALSVDGRPAREGERLRLPALARTIRRFAATAGEDLHTGRGARDVVERVQADGGILTAEDLAGYHVVDREPVVVRYRDHTLLTMPPPSSGGVVLAQALRVLEGHDVAALDPRGAELYHLLVETMKHGYADRAQHLGDPDFVDVPVEALLSDDRVAAIRAAFDPARTLPPDAYGDLIAPPRDAGTQHLSVVDAEGLAVALTTTINTRFGSQLVADGAGVVLNNEMDDFAAAPGVPNAFGLIQDEENAIAPGKRPLSSMTPTVVLGPDGDVVLVVGASGGSQIISATLQAVIGVVDFGLDPQAAVAAPRVHHQWQPDVLWVEPEVPRAVVDALRARGHEVLVRRHFSSAQAVSREAEGGRWLGGADPRKGGRAAAPRP